ncbi:hypothetical protein BV360_03794 [Pseudomonas syringae pv. actinidiae]|uniref:ATP-dependent Clp protease ATP-binding subunit ClpA n=1 Tax=Pseudomonas syringae pv. actinidiae TaxID=103796 RepID=A0AAN4TLC8_PSESF|nr:hypothetical protein BV340_03639 [Pseudomonas syringae pv. actinidiae]OSN16869.1 hypothetical protein BV339_03716 [Pseudomonas syringae pv. actinidiae]OSN25142.1 hypothetical protein BV341_03700 [Pseudomonas syringae pv. actinidiae]OSN32363.1 hypothetical protein BV343_03688 [Pseudomonas syringae pv. actinidiae]OSN33253.1 hypothetical protein BV342_03763 [Pseudomonas syringae pv. actinidiae]
MELGSLIARLNGESKNALQRAAQRCLQRGHHYVEIEHLLLELLDIEGGDFAYLLPRFGLERDALTAEINKALELFRLGSTRPPSAVGAHHRPAGRHRGAGQCHGPAKHSLGPVVVGAAGPR